MQLSNCTLEEKNGLKILFNRWSCGFYSNSYQTFYSLLLCLNNGVVPDKIDYTYGFWHFKRGDTLDIYPLFYKIDQDRTNLPLNKNLFLPDANSYDLDTIRLYNFEEYTKILDCFFSPVDKIIDIKNKLISDYNIDLEKTIAVFYRGTDKHSEVHIPSKEYVLERTKKLLNLHPECRVLIQTDQVQVRDFFKQELGDKCFYFNEVVTTDTNTVTWLLIHRSQEDPVYKAQLFDAVLRLVAGCKYVVNHTGNCGAFVDLLRGSMENTYKYDHRAKFLIEI